MLKIGDKAPAFKLKDQNEKTHTLSDYKGTWLLIYFYPKDDTGGCTTEACTIRDEIPQFEKLDCAILGVSADSIKSHKKFAEKYDLNFPILSDEEKVMINKYGAWGKKKFMGREYMGIFRKSFLIDPKGHIAKIYEKVKAAKHAEEVLADLETLK